MEQAGPGVTVPHEAINRALSRRLAAIQEEAAQLEAALETVVKERDEAIKLGQEAARELEVYATRERLTAAPKAQSWAGEDLRPNAPKPKP